MVSNTSTGKEPDETGIGWNDHGAATYKLKESLHPTYWTGEMACQMIQNYDNGNQPLFLKVSFARPTARTTRLNAFSTCIRMHRFPIRHW